MKWETWITLNAQQCISDNLKDTVPYPYIFCYNELLRQHGLIRVRTCFYIFSQLTFHSQTHYFIDGVGSVRGWELIRVIVLGEGKKVFQAIKMSNAHLLQEKCIFDCFHFMPKCNTIISTKGNYFISHYIDWTCKMILIWWIINRDILHVCNVS